MRETFQLLRFGLVSILLTVGLFGPAWTQHAYEASWHAGLLGVRQNPAAILTTPYRAGFLLGAANLSAQNNLFATNDFSGFSPQHLLNQLVGGPTSIPFMTNVNRLPFYAQGNDSWYGTQENHGQAIGAFYRLNTDPNLVEWGLVNRIFSFRLERNEVAKLTDIHPALAKGYAQDFANMNGQQLVDDFMGARVHEWDALVASMGVSIGKGINLLHLTIGGKLLSASSFMDFKAHGLEMDFISPDQMQIKGDSMVFAYNPSYKKAIQFSNRRRYDFFENSLGYAFDFGVIYQVRNLNRKPFLEVGASIQDIGKIQFWNLTHVVYRIPSQLVDRGLFRNGGQGIDYPNHILNTLTMDTTHKAAGITEALPLRLTLHGKIKLGDKGWGIQTRADFRRINAGAMWEKWVRATICYEKKGLSFFIPVSYGQFLSTSAPTKWSARVGLLATLGDVLILGSNDILSNFFNSSTRKGVGSSNIFFGMHFPIKRDQ